MSNYGYIGKDSDRPTQAFKSNAGVFSVNDIVNLDNENNWTTFGQLELIETQDITSATANIDFTDIKEGIYREHLLTCTNVETHTNNRHLVAKFSNDGGTTYETTSYYNSYMANNSFAGQTSNAFLQYLSSALGDAGNEIGNGWVRFHNLGDSDKRSYCTSSFADITQAGSLQTNIGVAMRVVEETVNAFRLTGHATTTFTGSFSLYGLREYT